MSCLEMAHIGLAKIRIVCVMVKLLQLFYKTAKARIMRFALIKLALQLVF